MNIEYKVNQKVSAKQFIELLEDSGLAERRPVDNAKCIDGMIGNSNLTVSAWIGSELVGIARSMTDFHYACYLSDLAVSKQYQQCGIGKQLQKLTSEQLEPTCSLILIAAPAADSYYSQVGFSRNPRCWVLKPGLSITS